jgi:hypothetical protein
VLAVAALVVITVVYLRTRDEGGQALRTGRHLVHLVDLNADVDELTMTVDQAQWLSGEQADTAWNDAHPDDPSGAPNGYFILDPSDDTVDLDMTDDVEVRVVDLARDSDADLDHLPLADLPDYLAQTPDPDGRWLSLAPYWITVRDDGTVGAIEEQYLP